MRAIAYMRRSQDSGTGVSEEIQDDAIREYVARKGGEVAYWLPPDLDASSWTLDRPSMQRALKLLADGKADTLVVAKLSRVTRRRRDWEQLMELMREQGWTIRSADFDIDLSDKGGRLIAGVLIDFLGYEYEEKRESYDEARRNAVLTHGVHGGSVPPLGYEFTVRGYDKAGRAQRGPLTPSADALKVTAAFAARAEGAPWLEVIENLGVKSQGHACSVIENRVYLGEARSGEFIKSDAHPALVDDATFRRANRQRTPRSVAYVGRDGALLGGGILRCASCGYALTHDGSGHGDHYRCKRHICTAKASIQSKLIEPYVFLHALAWHATLNPMHIADLNAATVPVYEEELAKAQAELDEVERLHEAGELSPVAYGKALTAAQYAVAAAETALADAEASRGWLGLNTAAVQRRLFGDVLASESAAVPARHIEASMTTFVVEEEDGSTRKLEQADPAMDLPALELGEPVVGIQGAPTPKNIQEARDFIRQMVRVTVRPVGRGRRVAVSERVEIENLTPVAALAEDAFVQFVRAGAE
jgi:DNA invertase Pin-like site-specific DNA recombinase